MSELPNKNLFDGLENPQYMGEPYQGEDKLWYLKDLSKDADTKQSENYGPFDNADQASRYKTKAKNLWSEAEKATLGRESQAVFALGQAPDGIPFLIMGIPEGAWEYMRDGRTHNFDFCKGGVPIRMTIFGGEDHGECMKVIETIMKQSKQPFEDKRDEAPKIELPPEKKIIT